MAPTRDPRPRVKPDLAQAEPQPATRERGGPADLVLDSVVSEPLRAVIRAQPTGPIGVIVELRTPGWARVGPVAAWPRWSPRSPVGASACPPAGTPRTSPSR